jgi:hypothetical protein
LLYYKALTPILAYRTKSVFAICLPLFRRKVDSGRVCLAPVFWLV